MCVHKKVSVLGTSKLEYSRDDWIWWREIGIAVRSFIALLLWTVDRCPLLVSSVQPMGKNAGIHSDFTFSVWHLTLVTVCHEMAVIFDWFKCSLNRQHTAIWAEFDQASGSFTSNMVKQQIAIAFARCAHHYSNSSISIRIVCFVRYCWQNVEKCTRPLLVNRINILACSQNWCVRVERDNKHRKAKVTPFSRRLFGFVCVLATVYEAIIHAN